MTTADETFQQALAHHRAGHIPEAAELYQSVLSANPSHADALYLLGVIAHQTGNHAPAVELLSRAISVAPDDARCYNVLGLALMELGRDDEAEANFQRGIAVRDSPELHNNLGTLWKKHGLLDDAMEAFQRALAQSPDYANAHYNLGNAWRGKPQMERAAECFQRALEIDPGHARAMVGLGQALQALHRPAEAVPILEKALARIPDDAELYCDLGDALQTLRQWQPAIDQYRKALECDAKSARAWYSAGCAQSSRNEHASAIFCFRKALEIDPGSREMQHNLGHSLFKLGQVGEAMELFRQAATAGDSEAADSAIAVIIPGDPGSGNQDVLEARREFANGRATCGSRAAQGVRPTSSHSTGLRGDRPIRVGYVSSFFQDHNWMKPVWGLIHQHDRSRFEVHLFSDAPVSAIRLGYRPDPQDQFHDITGLSAEAAAELIAKAGIDVLVDLNGYSALDRLPLIALRPAPRVMAWFNMYGTSGMSCYDFLIGDDVVIPPDEERFYTEKIARVPGSYLTFEVTYPVPDVADPPCSNGDPITFGCLASQYKITNEVIDAWSAILHQAPGSSLFLKNSALGSPGNRLFVHDLFEARRIPRERVRLESPAEHSVFLQAYGHVDIALDTFPYNGGTTTTEAIWQGVPVITFLGDRWVSRTSASILRAGGLGEFVAASVEEYIGLAARLANSRDTPNRLRDLRRNMRSRLLNSQICDTRTFAWNMERLYASSLSADDSQ